MSKTSERKPRRFGDHIRAEDIPETSDIRAIKYLSCQGGGMKGIGYVGAIRELDQTGVLSQLEEVAGSSAGGMFALMIAIGCTADELEHEMLSMDFRSFQDKRELGWVEASKLGSLFKGLAGLAKAADRINILKKAVKHIPVVGGAMAKVMPSSLARKGLEVADKAAGAAGMAEDLAALAFGSELGLWEGDALTHYLANLVARKTGNPNITFRELAALGHPFKKLTLTGSNLTTGELEYYNAQNTPDMPIIQAARISASFPGAYKPVIVEKKDKDGKLVRDEHGNVILDTKVDGGLLENLPDVFNKEPYTPPDPGNGKGGNKYAFALSFTSEEEKQPKKIKGIGKMLGAMYGAKTSEISWKKKYDKCIAEINTVGMGTLEFEATEEKKQELIESGKKSVRTAFWNILKKEEKEEMEKQEKSLELISGKELMRIKVALEDNPSEKNRDLRANVFEELIRRADENILSLEKQKDLEGKAKIALEKRKKFGAKPLTDKELSEACSEKIKKVETIVQQLEENKKNLALSKDALEFNRDLIVEKLNNEPDLRSELTSLRKLNNNIRQSSLNGDVAKHKVLKSERKAYYENLIEKYEENDMLLADFIRDLQEDSWKSRFVVPISENEVSDYCGKDITSCEAYIKEIEQELTRKTSKLSDVMKLQKTAEARSDKAGHYQELINLNNELDKTIKRKTTLLTKTNHFLIQRAPSFERVILSFSKVVAFLAFVCCLPVAVGPVLTAKAIRHFSSSPEVKATADNVIDFFRLTKVESEHQLRVLRDRTAQTIEAMSDTYAVAEKEETTSLYKAHQAYLGNSGLKVKEIFIKNPGESKIDHKDRVKKVKDKLTEGVPPELQIKESSHSKKAAENLENFQTAVLGVVKKIAERQLNTKDSKQAQVLQAQLDMSSMRSSEIEKMRPEEHRSALTAFHDARKKHGQEHGKVQPIKPSSKKK